MALPSNPLHRRLALAAAGAAVLAGGAGVAYANSLDATADPVVETGYAAVVDGDTNQTADGRDCPEDSAGGSSTGPESTPEADSAEGRGV